MKMNPVSNATAFAIHPATDLKRAFLLASALTVSLVFAVGSARAANYTWANSNVNGTPAATLNWFAATQGAWTGGTPVSSNANTIQFFGNATTALTNNGSSGNTQTSNIDNGGTAFQLGALTFSGRASATTGANLTMTISGDPLNFSAATGTINLDGTINGTKILTYNLNSAIQLGTGSSASALTITGAGTGTFNIGGNITELQTGGGSIVKSGSSTVTLTGANTYSGGTTLSAGTLTAQDSGANNFVKALGTGTVTLNGGTLNLRANGSGSSQTIITGDGTTGNNMVVGGNTTINVDRVSGTNTGNTYQFNNLSIGAYTLTVATSANANKIQVAGATTLTGNASFQLSNTNGDITLSGAIGGSGYGITKIGSGSIATLFLTAANTYTGLTSLTTASTTNNANTMQVSGANGSIATSTGVSISGRGSRLLLDYTGVAPSSVNRLNDNNANGVTLSLGGELSFLANSTALTNTTETMGQLALGNAYGVVTLTKTNTGVETITAGSFSRGANSATALIRGTALGTMGSATTATKLILTDATGVTQVGTTAANNLATGDTTKNLKIVPYLTGSSAAGGTGTTFVTYDSTLGFRTLDTTNEFSTYAAAATGDNVVVSTAVTGAATKTINSLLISATGANLTGNGTGNTLTVSSGAVFFSPSATGNNATISGYDSITLGNGSWNEGVITVGATSDLMSNLTNFGTLTIGSAIQGGSAGLTKAGRGTLSLTAANTYSGATTVTVGTLVVDAGGSISNSSAITVSAGATIQNANGAAITRNLSLSEGAALVTSAASSSFAPTSLTLTGDASNGWAPIALTNSAGGGLVKSGVLTLTISGLSATTYNLTSGSGFSGAFNSPGSINGYTLTTADSGATFTGTGGGFNYTYTNLDNTLSVAAVPEPTTWALFAASLTIVTIFRRRRNP